MAKKVSLLQATAPVPAGGPVRTATRERPVKATKAAPAPRRAPPSPSPYALDQKIKTTLDLPAALYHRLKIASVNTRYKMNVIIIDALEKHLKDLGQ